MLTLFAIALPVLVWAFVAEACYRGWRRHQEREGRTGMELRYDPKTGEFERY